jgi:hypothetical protein
MRALIRPWRSPATAASTTPPLGRNGCGITARCHHPLKGIMVRCVERPGFTQPVPRGVRRVEVRAGNPALRHRFGGGMGSPAL